MHHLIRLLDLYKRKVAAPRGTKRVVINPFPLNFQLHMTFMTKLDGSERPFFFDLLKDTNTGADFAEFVEAAVARGHLVSGDYLVVDNAAVHFSADTAPRLFQLLETAGVRYSYFLCMILTAAFRFMLSSFQHIHLS